MGEKINAYDERNEIVEQDEEYEATEDDVALEEIGNSNGEEEERKSRMQMIVPGWSMTKKQVKITMMKTTTIST